MDVLVNGFILRSSSTTVHLSYYDMHVCILWHHSESWCDSLQRWHCGAYGCGGRYVCEHQWKQEHVKGEECPALIARL